MAKAIEFLAPYPLDECKRRLEAQMNAPWSVLALAEARPLIGEFQGTRLRARKRAWFRHALQTYLFAELIAEGSETRIRCRFAMRLLDKIFCIVWFSGLLLIGGLAFFGTLFQALHRGLAGVWPTLFIFLWTVVLGSTPVGVGRYFARPDRRFLTDFIHETLNARRI